MPDKSNPDNKKTQATPHTKKKRPLQNIYRPDMEKLRLFTKMLRTNALYKKAKVTHK